MSAGRRLGSTMSWSGRGVANLLSTILRVVTICRTERSPHERTSEAAPYPGAANLLPSQAAPASTPLLFVLVAGLVLLAGGSLLRRRLRLGDRRDLDHAAPPDHGGAGRDDHLDGGPACEASFPVQVTDDNGTRWTFTAKPMRIVSTAPANT